MLSTFNKSEVESILMKLQSASNQERELIYEELKKFYLRRCFSLNENLFAISLIRLKETLISDQTYNSFSSSKCNDIVIEIKKRLISTLNEAVCQCVEKRDKSSIDLQILAMERLSYILVILKEAMICILREDVSGKEIENDFVAMNQYYLLKPSISDWTVHMLSKLLFQSVN